MKKGDVLEIIGYLKDLIKDTKFEAKVYVVGGAVRDMVMDNDIKDVDIVIELPNGGINFAEWLHDKKLLIHSPVTYPTYGTSQFILKEFPLVEIEAVETRKEQYKDKNSRNPEVVFGTLDEDCRRRDLTINALYYDVTNGRIIDLVGGQEDIKNKIIRTPSNPDVVFEDDPLRMIRVLRFSNRYHFEIDEATFNGIKKNHERLRIITQERITDELTKCLLTCEWPSHVIGDLLSTELFAEIFPEITDNREKINIALLTEIIKQDNVLKNQIEAYFAAILLNHTDVLYRMKLSNDFISKVINFKKSVDYFKSCPNEIEEYDVRMFGRAFGKHYYDCLKFLSIYVMHNMATLSDVKKLEQFKNYVDKFRNDGTMFDENTKLPITGDDIMKRFKLKPSPVVGDLMNIAWDYYYSYPTINKEELLNMVYKYGKHLL